MIKYHKWRIFQINSYLLEIENNFSFYHFRLIHLLLFQNNF